MSDELMNTKNSIAVAGCKHTTRELIQGLMRCGYKVDYCITISPEKGEEQKVAGYYDLREFLAENNIEAITAQKYNLQTTKDKDTIKARNIGILLVMGWQRLIPDWLLDHIRIGAFGMHGSSKMLPHGRGRSPMNWSLIQGKTQFYTHLFQYLPGVDDGPIVGIQKFDITEHDNCLTLHNKNTVSMIKLCETYLPALFDGTATLDPQPKAGVSYYPKREEADGIIMWNKPAVEIYNLIRAVTKPFPGAFTFLKGNKLRIWRAIPFDSQFVWNGSEPGQILEVFSDTSFVVKCSDNTILVQEHEGLTLSQDCVGTVLHSNNIQPKVWHDLPD